MSRLPTHNPSSASLPSAAQTLTDPEPKQIDAAVLDYLLIELTNTLKHSAAFANKRLKEREAALIKAGLLAPPPPRKDHPSVRDSMNSTASSTSNRNTNTKPLDETEEAVRVRLENIGMVVGGNLAERLSRARSTRFADPLDTVKFLCKDVWSAVWDKPVDNLRTNHRGIYVLQDNSFKPLLRISSPQGSQEALRKARLYLAYPTGLIKGALQRLGLLGVVVPETTTLPQCTFQVKQPKASP